MVDSISAAISEGWVFGTVLCRPRFSMNDQALWLQQMCLDVSAYPPTC
jgi:hypothetical protein